MKHNLVPGSTFGGAVQHRLQNYGQICFPGSPEEDRTVDED